MLKSLARLSRHRTRYLARASHNDAEISPKPGVRRSAEKNTLNWVRASKETRFRNEPQTKIHTHLLIPDWYIPTGSFELKPSLISDLEQWTSTEQFVKNFRNGKIRRRLVRILTEANARRSAGSYAQDYPQLSLRILALSHAIGVHHRGMTWAKVAHRFAESGHWTHLLQLDQMCREQTGEESVSLIEAVVNGLSRSGYYARLHFILPGLAQVGYKPSRNVYLAILKGHIRNRDVPSARQMMAQMEQAGFTLDAETDAHIAAAYSSLGLHLEVEDRALKAVAELPSDLQLKTIMNLMSTRVQRGDTEIAMSYLKRLPTEMINDSPVAFAQIIDFHIEDGQLDEAFAVYQEALRLGFASQPSIAAAFVRLLTANGQLRDAVIYLQSASGRQSADVLALWDKLVDLLPESPLPKFPVDLGGDVTLHLTPSIFEGLLQKVIRRSPASTELVIALMRAHHIWPESHIIMAVLEELNEHGLCGHGADILVAVAPLVAQRRGQSVDLDCANALVAAWIRHVKIYVFLRQTWKTSEGSKPDIHIWSAPRKRNPGPLVDIPVPSYMDEIVEKLVEQGVQPSAGSYRNRIRYDAVLCLDPQSARQVLESMVVRGIAPDESHYISLMEGYILLRDTEGALGILQEARSQNLVKTTSLYVTLARGFYLRRDPAGAYRVLLQMLEDRVTPDAQVVYYVSQAFVRSGSKGKAKAQEILLRYWPQGVARPDVRQRRMALVLRDLFRPPKAPDEKKETLGERKARLTTVIELTAKKHADS